jgi:hypothetical protein
VEAKSVAVNKDLNLLEEGYFQDTETGIGGVGNKKVTSTSDP